MKFRFFAPLLLVGMLIAQAKPTPKPDDPTSAPASVKVDSDRAVSLLQLQHKIDETNKQMSDLDNNFLKFQAQAKSQYEAFRTQLAQQQAELDKARADAFKAAKLDPAGYDLELDSMTFKPKPTQAKAAAPAPK